MYIQVNEKAPPAEQIRQLKNQLEIILDNLEIDQVATGDSLPEGGTDGQVLTKQSDGSADWEDPTGGTAENGLPAGGTTDQMLVKNSNADYDGKWVAPYSHPASHAPSIIAETTDDMFVSASEKAHWNGKQAALGFTPENATNKKTSLTDNSDDYYPTQKAVKSALDGKSNIGHGHAISDITNLQTTLDGKAASSKGVPTGGTTDQVLAKNSNTDNDLKWVTPASGGSNILATNNTEVTVTNTTTETEVFSGLTVLANTLGANGGLKFAINFDENHSVVATTSIRIKMGGVTTLTIQYPQGSVEALKPSLLIVECRNIGSTNKQRWFAIICYKDGTAKQIYGYDASTIDTTVDCALSLTVQHNTANTGVYYKQYNLIVEKIVS